MTTFQRRLSSMVACGFLSATAGAVCAADTYRFLKEISVGGPSSWDYLSVDPAGRRVYASHGTEVVVIDIEKDALTGTGHKIYLSQGERNTPDTFKVLVYQMQQP